MKECHVWFAQMEALTTLAVRSISGGMFVGYGRQGRLRAEMTKTRELIKWYFCKHNSDPFCEHSDYEYCIYKDCGKYQSPDWQMSREAAG